MTWYILEGERVTQIGDEAFRLQIASGEISPLSKIWTEGMPEWVPASNFISFDAKEKSTSRPYALLASATFVIVSTIYFTMYRSRALDVLNEQIGVGAAVTAIAVMSVLLAGAGTFIAYTIWNRADRRSASKFAGFVFLLGGAAALIEGVLAASFLLQARDAYRMIVAAQSYADGSVALSDNFVNISGTLGPHLMRDFTKIVSSNRPIRGVRVTSPGGLISSAIELANYLEQHQTVVIITGPCSSACILLAVASRESYANHGVWFGFHHTYPVVSAESEIMRASMEQTWEVYRSYLIKHGVPEVVLQEAAKHGADSVLQVAASDMAHYGAIKAVFPPGEWVPEEQ